MKLYVTVCKNTVLQNIRRKRADRKPPLRVSRGKYGKPSYHFGMMLTGPVTIIYDPDRPLPWGARAWIEMEVP